MSIVDRFTLINIANDYNMTYDSLVNKIIVNGRVPIECPIDIIIQILSRHFNVNTTLYDENMCPIDFFNAVNDDPTHMFIYRYSYDQYYNMVPIGQTFSGVGKNFNGIGGIYGPNELTQLTELTELTEEIITLYPTTNVNDVQIINDPTDIMEI